MSGVADRVEKLQANPDAAMALMMLVSEGLFDCLLTRVRAEHPTATEDEILALVVDEVAPACVHFLHEGTTAERFARGNAFGPAIIEAIERLQATGP